MEVEVGVILVEETEEDEAVVRVMFRLTVGQVTARRRAEGAAKVGDARRQV